MTMNNWPIGPLGYPVPPGPNPTKEKFDEYMAACHIWAAQSKIDGIPREVLPNGSLRMGNAVSTDPVADPDTQLDSWGPTNTANS